MKNTPTEIVEAETMIRVRQYQLQPDTYAAGKWRGGAAIIMDLENTDIEAVMAVRGLNRFQFASWGVQGGRPGVVGQVILNPGRNDERIIERLNILELRQGDLVRMITPTGGGSRRSRASGIQALVVADVRSGLLSGSKALDEYGVVIADGAVDVAATTRARRTSPRVHGDAAALFTFCAERQAYEAIWLPVMRAELAKAVLLEEAWMRHHLLTAVRDELAALGRPVDELALLAAFNRAKHGLMFGSGTTLAA